MSASDTKDKEKQEKIKQLAETLGINHIFTEIDSLKENVGYLKTEFQRVLEQLQHTNTSIDSLNQTLQGGQAQNPIPTTANPSLSNLPMGQAEKVGMLLDAAEGISKIITAWKGTSPQAATSPLGQLGETMIQDLVRATVDDIQQRVYGIRKLPPPTVAKQVTHELE